MNHDRKPWMAALLSVLAPGLGHLGAAIGPSRCARDLGGNRDASYDGRYWGFLPLTAIVGEPTPIYYSYDVRARGTLHWLTSARWSRIGLRFP